MAERIVVIDDVREILLLLHDILTDEGYEVLPFMSPIAALKVIPHERPDLIISDCIFNQELSCRYVLHTLKTQLATAHIPIILCTGVMSMPTDITSYIEARQVAVLRKPFNIDVLLDLVHDLV